jgi:hypothetical protein
MGARFRFRRGTQVNRRIDLENFRELKKVRRFRFDEVRQRFRLTPTEKRVAVFVLAAFVLGLGNEMLPRHASAPSSPNQTKTTRA